MSKEIRLSIEEFKRADGSINMDAYHKALNKKIAEESKSRNPEQEQTERERYF